MNRDLNKMLKNLGDLVKKAQSELTPEQQMQIAQFQTKTNGIFKGIGDDLTKVDVADLVRKSDEIKDLANNIIDGISSNK